MEQGEKLTNPNIDANQILKETLIPKMIKAMPASISDLPRKGILEIPLYTERFYVYLSDVYKRQGKMERVEKVKLLLLFRIYSNLYSSLLLTVQVLKSGKISFFQLPIGLLLRCCFTDCLFALYIQRAGKERAYEELIWEQ